MKKHKRIPTILAILILFLGTMGGVYLVTSTKFIPSQAETQISPKDIRVSNLSDNSLTISYLTDTPTLGLVNWGTTSNLGNTTTDEDLTLKKIHLITLNNLEPGTTYYYNISSSGTPFDNAGIPWQTQTLLEVDSTPNSGVVSGTLVDSSGSGVANALVYVDSEGITTLSAKTQESGNFIIPLTLTTLSPEAVLTIFAQAENGETSSAQILARSTNPIPNMTLGQTHDFRNIENIPDTTLPKSSIDVPNENQEPESKIILDSQTPQPTPTKPVTLDNIDEGDTIDTPIAKFSGEAPAGTRLTITVQSDPITGQLVVPQSGEWTWTVPEGLEPGEHTVTIQWLDVSGVLRELSKSFTVSAQEMPTSSPASSPRPTTSPKPSPILVPTPKPTILATPSPIPVSGSLTHTLVISIIGIGFISTGLIISLRTKK